MQVSGSALVRLELSTWRTDAGDLDILADIPDGGGRHLSYWELVDRASELHLDGIVVRVAALEDVIASKEWADRPKDREALPELRRSASSRINRCARRRRAPDDGATEPAREICVSDSRWYSLRTSSGPRSTRLATPG